MPLNASTELEVGCVSGELERDIDLVLTSHEDGAAVASELKKRLLRAKIYFAGRLLPTFPKPHIVRQEHDDKWGASVAGLVRLLERAGQILLKSKGLRAELGLDPESDHLLHVDPGYTRLVVNTRFDVVWAGARIKVIEVNADSPAMMTFTDQVEQILFEIPALRSLLERTRRPPNRTRALLRSMVDCYREWGGTKSHPTVAIVDWPNQSTANELLHTAAVFEAEGYPTVVCHPGELEFRDGGLHAGGHRIDIVQRRVLFPDFVRKHAELDSLIKAYAQGKVCMANSLRSYLVGNKAALSLVANRPDEFDLSADERALIEDIIPPTRAVDAQIAQRLLAEKDCWVLKGAFGSGGKEVTLGNSVTDSEWADLVDQAQRMPSVAQQLLPIPRLQVPVAAANGAITMKSLYANWNPWLFGGEYCGATVRVSESTVVSITAGGGLLPCLTV